MDWIKKHADSAVVLSAVVVSVCWMNGKFDEVSEKFSVIERQISDVRTDLAVVKTALVIRGVLPSSEMACSFIDKNQEGEKGCL